ncbi:DUF6250 domain-containing protein [Allorhodopirellula solitaria]|uniref:DUF6250 domain-containing protein n=1 Tax=Allorhodopirellula solitaria TaxID=2527987 RepID=A0A5C5Y1A4_9BACT|nr:DUF6250 domain-containing protein [Allorhodopirellula solitaria]TWT67382.1 hypothetical protein CA85_22320 [Allorhodopirellula solitaria]
MKSQVLTLIFAILPLFSNGVHAEDGPVVLGHGEGLFRVGSLLAEDDFENLDRWDVQIQQRSGYPPAKVVTRENSLDCLVPGRGCTAWFKQKFDTRVVITYEVICPTPQPEMKGVQPRDINNFWMATDPSNVATGLFDADRYTGKFSSYDKIHGYYASTGGGGAIANRTTRMRRYPREVEGKPEAHLALKDKDERPGYLITPDKVMKIQLVAYDDVVQYIVDGKLVYEIAQGDLIRVEGTDDDGDSVVRESTYDLDRFPVYREGFFGFRMVGTHHIYTNFRAYALEPVQDNEADSDDDNASAEGSIEVSTLADLRNVMQQSNQNITMKPGRYLLTDLPEEDRKLSCSGSNNTIDLSGVHIVAPVGSANRGYFNISGSDNVLHDGTLEDVYESGLQEVADFSTYNRNRSTLAKGLRGDAVLSVTGDDNVVRDTKLTIRGSFPYGYGSLYGIGSDNVYGLDKRCGILIRGKRNIIDGCEVQQKAFGHGIYMQKPADQTVIKNCLVAGIMRPSNDLYLETDPSDLPVRSEYKIPQKRSRGRSQRRDRRRGRDRDRTRNATVNREVDENPPAPLPRDTMLPLSEDGIRVYSGGGSVTVENCTVKRMRGGIRLYLASHAAVTNSTAIDCGHTNFNMPKGGTITGSKGNFAYAPLSDFRLSKSNQKIELTIMPSPHAVGPHHLADVLGNNHHIILHRTPGPLDTSPRPIVIAGSGSTIRNETEYPVKLLPSSSGNTVVSAGPVTDQGSNNTVSQRSLD